MGVLKFTTVNGFWKKLWTEADDDFWGFPNQWDKIRTIIGLAHVVPDFQDLEEADIQEVLESHAAEVTEKDLEHLTAHREWEDVNRLTQLWTGLS
jgi:hypothetical protein